MLQRLAVKILFSLALLFSCPLTEAMAQASQPTVFRLGVLPNVSARVIVTNYQPMRAYLERELGRPVEILTAPDFKSFYQRSVAGEYDLSVIAANLGRLAEVDRKLKPIAIFDPPIRALLVMMKNRPVKDLGELKGHALAVANPQSLVVLRGLEYLRQAGLLPDRDFKTVRAANEDSLAQLLASGEAPLAMMSLGEFRIIREQIRDGLEIFSEFAQVPGFLVLQRSGLSPADAAAEESVFLKFAQSAEAPAFFSAAGVQGIRPPKAEELRDLDPYVADTRRFMQAP